MPRSRAQNTSASLADINLATGLTQWELLAEAVERGPFPGTRALEIAQRSPKFSGGDTAARDHADRLVGAGILVSAVVSRRVQYSAAPKGRAIHARVRQLEQGRLPRTTSEAGVVAFIARVPDDHYDLLELVPGSEVALVAELRTGATDLARVRKTLRTAD